MVTGDEPVAVQALRWDRLQEGLTKSTRRFAACESAATLRVRHNKPREGLGMAKLGEPAVYRPGGYYVVCLRCKATVGIENDGSSVRLTYDIQDCQRRTMCCCLHLDGPVSCCSFDDLRQVINDLPLPH
jgi:hypothetical protein